MGANLQCYHIQSIVVQTQRQRQLVWCSYDVNAVYVDIIGFTIAVKEFELEDFKNNSVKWWDVTV